MGVLVVVTNRKKFYLKNVAIFLVLISFSFLTGCGFLQQLSSFSVKPIFSIDSAKNDKDANNEEDINETIHRNIESNLDKVSNEHGLNEDKADKDNHANQKNINDNEQIDNNSIINNNDDDNSDTNNSSNNNGSADNNSNVGNNDMIDSNIKDNNADKNNNENNDNEEIDQTNDSTNFHQLQAEPAAKIIPESSNKELKRVAITFDDGPDEYFTPQVLDILKEYNVKATFFIVGSVASKNPDVLKRIDEEGHVVASHGWSHSNFTKMSDKKIAQELQKTNDLIEEITGKPTSLFRLPYGDFNQRVLETVANEGYHNIYWSIDPRDWSGISSKEIVNHIKEKIEPGAIILLHSNGSKDSIPNTAKALPHIIEYLQEQGYEMVTIPELLEDSIMVNSTID